MRIIVKKSVSAINSNGKVRSAFSIIQGDEKKIQKIEGVSRNNKGRVFNVVIKTKKLDHFQDVVQKDTQYKLKPNDIYNIFDESKKVSNNNFVNVPNNKELKLIGIPSEKDNKKKEMKKSDGKKEAKKSDKKKEARKSGEKKDTKKSDKKKEMKKSDGKKDLKKKSDKSSDKKDLKK